PIAILPLSHAALIAPRPHLPATWKTTSEPCAIWSRAISLHLAMSSKSCEYAFSVFTPGLVSFTACWKPAIQLSTDGSFFPPTDDTVPVFVISAATTPASYPDCSEG